MSSSPKEVYKQHDFACRAVVPPSVLIRHLDSEAVLLNLDTERYFGLDATGSRMWEVVTKAPNIASAFHDLSQEYDVQPELLKEHLSQLLAQLVDNGLLTVQPADVGTPPAL
jgi:Coenzyme PQQ synthesis protein D (PqqD)